MTQPADANTIADYAALQTGAGLVTLAAWSQIEITGADRVSFLHGFCTADIKKLPPGQGVEAFITNHQGKATGHGLIFAEQDRLLFDGAPNQAEKLIAHWDRFVIGERVEFRDRTGDWANLLLAGPQAEALLSSLNANLPATRLAHQPAVIAGREVTVRRVDWLPVPGLQLNCASEHSESIRSELLSHGAREVSEAAWHMARVEAGYPLYGVDITEDNLPQEVQRTEQAISFTKGCYLGQETIARLDALGHVNRVLTGLRFVGEHTLASGEAILQGEKKLATITSVAWSPRLQSPLALAYVRTLHATPGKRLSFPGGEAEVVKLPLAAADWK